MVPPTYCHIDQDVGIDLIETCLQVAKAEHFCHGSLCSQAAHDVVCDVAAGLHVLPPRALPSQRPSRTAPLEMATGKIHMHTDFRYLCLLLKSHARVRYPHISYARKKLTDTLNYANKKPNLTTKINNTSIQIFEFNHIN